MGTNKAKTSSFLLLGLHLKRIDQKTQAVHFRSRHPFRTPSQRLLQPRPVKLRRSSLAQQFLLVLSPLSKRPQSCGCFDSVAFEQVFRPVFPFPDAPDRLAFELVSGELPSEVVFGHIFEKVDLRSFVPDQVVCHLSLFPDSSNVVVLFPVIFSHWR